MNHAGLAEPPEGVTSGDTVPRENERHDVQEAEIREAIGCLKTVEAYKSKSDDELREMAKEILL